MKNIIVYLLISLFSLGCTIKESPIDYGKDACNFCKMNIVDNQHAAEIVTSKGKPLKYDAIECMVKELKTKDENEISLILIADYLEPGKLIDATNASYLISPNISSPMGANLSGFKNKPEAEKSLRQNGGKLYSWNELKGLF